MKKHTYRLRRAYGVWAAGEEVELTEVEAIELDNAAPGVIERIIPDAVIREMSRAQGEGHPLHRPARPQPKEDI